jgi:bacterioferritin-associated ferredoxin
MYVCVCLAVTDQEVNSAIEEGARSREEVTRACSAGGDCGACHGMIEDMIDERLAEAGEGVSLIPASALTRERAA